MAGCMCGGGTCSCLLTAGTGVQVDGVGSERRPYRVTAAPHSYNVRLTSSSPSLNLISPSVFDVGSRAVFDVEIDPGVSATIRMPDESTSYRRPALGSAMEFLITGAKGTSDVAWSGGPISWFGGAPTATGLGWYRFVYVGYGFSGEYLGSADL